MENKESWARKWGSILDHSARVEGKAGPIVKAVTKAIEKGTDDFMAYSHAFNDEEWRLISCLWLTCLPANYTDRNINYRLLRRYKDKESLVKLLKIEAKKSGSITEYYEV